MIKIALSGPKGGGKTWVMGQVAKQLDFKLQAVKMTKNMPSISTLAFADPIYDAQYSLFAAALSVNMSGRVFNEWMKGQGLDDKVDSVIGITPRGFRQRYGTEFAREFNPDVWVNIMSEKLNMLDNELQLAQVVLDVRFPNEHEMLKARGFDLFYVNAMGKPEQDSHASESHLIKIKEIADVTALDKAGSNKMVDTITSLLLGEIMDKYSTGGIITTERKIKMTP